MIASSHSETPLATEREEWRRSWKIPVVAAVSCAVSVTHWYSFGLFLPELEREFGWSRVGIAAGLTILSVISVVLAPVAGMMIDRFGSRRIAVPGILLYCGSIGALSQVGPTIYSWWITWIFVGLFSLAIKPAVWTTAISTLFNKGRGVAIAIALCGNGLGQMLMPSFSAFMIDRLGWRDAFLGIAGVNALIAAPLVWLFFYDARDGRRGQTADRHPAYRPVGLTSREAITSRRFWTLAIISLCFPTGVTAIAIPFVPIMTERGLSVTIAAAVAGLIGAGAIAGRLISGGLFDRFDGRVIGVLSFIPLLGAAASMLFFGASLVTAAAVAVLLGLGTGGATQSVAYLVTRYFGTRNLGTVTATLIGLQSMGGGLGPLLSSYVYDRAGTYDAQVWMTIPLFLLCLLLVGTLGAYPDFASRDELQGKGQEKTPRGAAPSTAG